jgi:hypothetical protein
LELDSLICEHSSFSRIKGEKAMFLIADIKTENDQRIAVINVLPKQFKTGSRGFYTNQKIEIDGKRYQMQIQVVEIGSKTSESTEA